MLVGAPGVVRGVIADEADEAEPVPTSLMVEMRKVYAVPFVRPVTVYEVEVEPVSAVTSDHDPEFFSTL